MSLRQQELPRLEWVTETVKEMKEKFFFEKFPNYKDFYKQYKKDVETFKYASDEPVYYHEDKSGLSREYTRPEILFIPLRMDYNKLVPVVEKALKLKKEEDERKERVRLKELYEDQLTMGRISKEKFELLRKNGWDRTKLYRGAGGVWREYL